MLLSEAFDKHLIGLQYRKTSASSIKVFLCILLSFSWIYHLSKIREGQKRGGDETSATSKTEVFVAIVNFF